MGEDEDGPLFEREPRDRPPEAVGFVDAMPVAVRRRADLDERAREADVGPAPPAE